MCILEPWDRGSRPHMERVLEGRQFFAAQFSSDDTACPAHIIVETYSRECIVYFGTFRQTVDDPIHRACRGQPVFS